MPGRPPANPHAATTPDGPAPGYDPPARWWTILRHALSIAVTTAVIVTAFTVLTLPLAAVFLLDDVFVVRDFAEAVLIALGVGFAASVLVFPVAFGFERRVMRGGTAWKALAACAPVAAPITAALILASLFEFQPSAAVGNALDIAVLLLVSFSVYWLALWSLNALRHGARRLCRRVAG
ncbi:MULTISPECIES: hypothetical protein [Kitasatospora]|uniref:Uncharacterized protein n=1 Tax=Kitasatospora arboriphila TaxID=258052 RepID=A0ABN1TUC4_9ACTN